MKEKLSHEELIAELDHLFRCAHGGHGVEDKEFKCTIEACPQIYEQIKKLINDQWGAEQYFLDTIKELQRQLKSAKT